MNDHEDFLSVYTCEEGFSLLDLFKILKMRII